MTENVLGTIRNGVLRLPQALQDHIERVGDISKELAYAHTVSPNKVALCAQAHDLCRAMNGKDLLLQARRLNIPVLYVEKKLPILLHGPVAAELLRRDGLTDDDVYQGVYYHSTAYPGLSKVAKVVFLADKLDPHKAKRYPYLPELKAAALENLDKALLQFLTRELSAFLKTGQLIHPASIEARNELLLMQ